MDVKYSGDARMSQFKYSWDNMIRNLRSNILRQEPKTVEYIFHKLLKNSDALRPYLQYYERLRDDHPDRTYTFLSEMVDKAIREERHRRNQEELVTPPPAVEGAIICTRCTTARQCLPECRKPKGENSRELSERGRCSEGKGQGQRKR